jgi:hypothetical protein
MEKYAEFQPGQLLKHLKTGGHYKILHLAKLESTKEDVYVYEALINHTIWVRSSAQMLDGRFEPIV